MSWLSYRSIFEILGDFLKVQPEPFVVKHQVAIVPELYDAFHLASDGGGITPLTFAYWHGRRLGLDFAGKITAIDTRQPGLIQRGGHVENRSFTTPRATF